MGIKGYT